MLESGADIVLAVDASPLRGQVQHRRDLVIADRPFNGDFLDDTPVILERAGTDIPPAGAS